MRSRGKNISSRQLRIPEISSGSGGHATGRDARDGPEHPPREGSSGTRRRVAPISSRGVAVARGRAETKDTGIAINSREAPPMLRNCSSAFELSTAAADTGRRVVSGRALSCVWGGVTTARVTGATLRALARVARAATTGFPPVANPALPDPTTLDLFTTHAAFAAEAHEAAISRMPKYACVYRRCVASRTALS